MAFSSSPRAPSSGSSSVELAPKETNSPGPDRTNVSDIFLNIVTPCTRPHNLPAISRSINIPRDRYRWVVVFDSEPYDVELPQNCEAYFHRDPSPIPGSLSRGDAQRNFAIEMIHTDHVYLNDDDTTIHPDLWDAVRGLAAHDFISFDQGWRNGAPRLDGSVIGMCRTDSHNFIASRELIGDTRMRTDVYESDGHLVEEIYPRARNPIYIPRTLSVFNSLDRERQAF